MEILSHTYSLDSISLRFSAVLLRHTRDVSLVVRKRFSLLLRFVDTEDPWKTHGKKSIGVPEKRMLDVDRSSVVLLSKTEKWHMSVFYVSMNQSEPGA